MYEKVNPAHPDKQADRIAGALVDLAYRRDTDPRIAVEVLLGHHRARIMAETSVHIEPEEVAAIVERIAGDDFNTEYTEVPQDPALAGCQEGRVRCADNGIFRGSPITAEEHELTEIAQRLYRRYGTDGKYLTIEGRMTICQSHASSEELRREFPGAVINPLGDWDGGTDVDTGATNRKLGSDLGGSLTGGGIHGKDLSKADVSLTIYAFRKAQISRRSVEMACSIGDAVVDGKPYSHIVEEARYFVREIGGFEAMARWGLIR